MEELKPSGHHQDLTERERKLKEQQERQDLLFKTETLVSKPSNKKEDELIQLLGGRYTSVSQTMSFIKDCASDCDSMFPRSKPFFKLMYKLNDWDKLNPDDFIKPPCVALWIKQFIYARFDKDVLPTLLDKYNPYVSGHVKKYKLYQFLNTEGLMIMEGFINDAIRVMEDSENWHDFELKYGKQYHLSIQLKLFK